MTEELISKFEEVVQKYLGDGLVHFAMHAVPSDEDLPVYEVGIVYDAAKVELTPTLMSKISAGLWRKEAELGGDRFPVPYFTELHDHDLNVA